MLATRELRHRDKWLLAGLGLIIVALCLGFVVQVGLHSKALYVLTSARQASERMSIRDARICRCAAEQEVSFARQDGLTIAGSLYGLEGADKRTGILLLHGNTPEGRNLPFYNVLARGLADRGYLVLAIDFPGSGESDDPYEAGDLEALDRDPDVIAALEYMKSLPNLDQDQIYLLGHSGGAGAAYSVGITSEDVRGIALIGPPRRSRERAADPEDTRYFWERANRSREAVYGDDFPAWFTFDVWSSWRLGEIGELEANMAHFAQADHKPLLLIDGENEGEVEKAYLESYFQSITEPKRYVTIPDSDHYANSNDMPKLGGFMLYDSKAVSAHVVAIDRWINDWTSAAN